MGLTAFVICLDLNSPTPGVVAKVTVFHFVRVSCFCCPDGFLHSITSQFEL